jgi:hypothetical protein
VRLNHLIKIAENDQLAGGVNAACKPLTAAGSPAGSGAVSPQNAINDGNYKLFVPALVWRPLTPQIRFRS